MPFAYYERLSRAQQKIYRDSDGVTELRRRVRAWGLGEVIVSFADEGLLERFAREVMPRV